jgi:hypothetical protein
MYKKIMAACLRKITVNMSKKIMAICPVRQYLICPEK